MLYCKVARSTISEEEDKEDSKRRDIAGNLHLVFRALHGSHAPLRRVIPLRIPFMMAVGFNHDTAEICRLQDHAKSLVEDAIER